ncbi:hypothetical protein KC723_02545 [Candidatus Kaiserbacteria bacterium]|nr:hypothetical protein [Candidatus Kaiserbacteria bacterium]
MTVDTLVKELRKSGAPKKFFVLSRVIVFDSDNKVTEVRDVVCGGVGKGLSLRFRPWKKEAKNLEKILKAMDLDLDDSDQKIFVERNVVVSVQMVRKKKASYVIISALYSEAGLKKTKAVELCDFVKSYVIQNEI